jgi:hypothetical protein
VYDKKGGAHDNRDHRDAGYVQRTDGKNDYDYGGQREPHPADASGPSEFGRDRRLRD